MLDRFARMSDRSKAALLVIACAGGFLTLVVLFVRTNANAETEECVHSLHHLVDAKWFWAEEHHAASNATPTWSDLRPYYIGPTRWPKDEPAPRCPGGGTWMIGRVNEMPTCSIAKHTASLRHDFDEIEETIRHASSNAPGQTLNGNEK
jgi:hypothetical protein